MDLLVPTVNQMIFLFTLILIGYILVKTGILEASSASVLSKLENNLFIPALIAGTFITNFTASTLASAWKILLFSLILELILIPIMVLISRKCSPDPYLQKICTYGLCFSNFGFMGNAVVKAIFPDLFTEYILFTLPLWSCIYLWGVPTLLIPNEDAETASISSIPEGELSSPESTSLRKPRSTLRSRLKSFCNPMFAALLIGMIIGLAGLPIPAPIRSVLTVCGDCMSPMAMLLTGITIGGMNLKGTLRESSIYVSTFLRLLVLPAVFLGLFQIISVPDTLVICTICSLAMPLGLSTVVIPAGYGKDTSVAAGMALVSHLASMVTIPIVFLLLRMSL